MGSVSPLFLMVLFLMLSALPPSSSLSPLETEKFTATLEDRTVTSIRSPRLLDLIIRDYTVKLLNERNFRTGEVNNVQLPGNLSGIEVNTARYRCGSLRRYGAHIKEFHVGKGVTINPCVERVIFIREKMESNWSSIYYDSYNLDGYELVTPILGLLAYNGGDDDRNASSPNPFELGIIANGDVLKVDFTNVTKVKYKVASGYMPYCASFEGKGKVTLSSMVAPQVCGATKHGHFGLVVKATGAGPSPPAQYPKTISRWKIALGSSVGAALGAFLLGLLLIAMLVKAKKRSKLEEMVRRAYEEEALQVSMVGHVRAPTAPPTRTVPIIERDYRPPFF